MENEIKFKHIIDIQRWSNIQDHFSDILGVMLRTVDTTGALLARPSDRTRAIEGIVDRHGHTVDGCYRCLPSPLGENDNNWEEGYECPATHLRCYAIPIQTDTATVAYIVMGPVLVGMTREQYPYEAVSKRTKISREELRDSLREIRVFSFSSIRSAVTLLADIGRYICQVSYNNLKLKEISLDSQQVIGRLEQYFTERLFDALLKVATDCTGAERGSIMVADEKSEDLFIKISKGLDQNIVNSARSRKGQGIAGIAVQERRTLVLNGKVDDQRIQNGLHIPELTCSIVIPIIVRDKVLGVLSVGTTRPKPDAFIHQGIGTIDKLTNLVETTLANLRNFQPK